MRALGCAVLALALMASCARRVETQHPLAVTVAMERQVRNAVDAGDGDLRIRTLRERVVKDPGNLEVRLSLAAAYEERGYPEIAVEHYRTAASRFPDDAAVTLRLAGTLRRMDLAPEAAETLEKFLEGHPAAGEVHNRLGVVLDESGEFTRAEKAFRAAVDAMPASDAVHNNLGYNLLLQGRPKEAAVEFRRALELQPRSEIARNNLGIALAAADSKEAVVQWESLSGPASAHNNLAAILIEQGKYTEAREELQRALEFQRNHAAALRNLSLLGELDGKATQLGQADARRRRGVMASIGHGLARAMGSTDTVRK